MNTNRILLALTVLCIVSTQSLAQDVVFTQWESMPLQFNPALTGNFDGLIRLSAKHRNQWRSLLGKSSYKANAVSAEYKIPGGDARKISVGLLGIQERAGSLDFRTTGIHVSTSVLQNIGDIDGSHHAIAIGVNVGMATKKIDLENAQWPGMPEPDLNDKTNYADVSAGLLYQYKSNTHFSFQLGSSLYHINKPNTSFSDSSVSRLSNRLNFHGSIEIPLLHSFSLAPSVFYWSKGPGDQLMFGINTRWYPTSSNPDYVQLGFFGKTSKDYNGVTEVATYALSAAVDINSILVGFSFDRFENVESNAIEFSIGYRFGGRG